jgi:PAS domain S-box-containing protein
MNKKFLNALKESFGLKMLSAFVAVIIVVLTAFTLFAAFREGKKVKKGLREQGEMLAGVLAHDSLVGVFAENEGLLRASVQGIMGLKDVTAVSVYSADLKVLFTAGTLRAANDPLTVLRGNAAGLRSAASLHVVETEDAFEFFRPVVLQAGGEKDESMYFGGAAAGQPDRVVGYVRIALSKDSYHSEILSVVAQHAVIMLIFVFSSIVIVYAAVKKVTRPLEKLTENVKALGRGLPVEPVPVETADEIGNLASAFNAMAVARGLAEASLRESEERYRKLVELSPDAIYVQFQGKIAFINAAGAVLLGAAGPSQLIGRPVSDLVHESDRGAMQRRFLRVEQEKITALLLPVRYLRLDGTAVDAEAAAAPYTFEGRQAVLVIARDVTERKGMEEKIRTYQNELYSVAAEMSSLESRIEERERHLIAADLHDYVGQNLVVSQFKLASLRKYLSAPDAAGHLEEVQELIGQTIEYTRSLTIELNPPILVEIGLHAAVESLAEGFEKIHGIRVIVEDDGLPKQTGEDVRYLLFRSVRELLMNAVKHSRAGSIRVSLERSLDSIRITVADDGLGFEGVSAIRKNGGFGLFTVRERLKRAGGSCEIVSIIGAGTTVILSAPLER